MLVSVTLGLVCMQASAALSNHIHCPSYTGSVTLAGHMLFPQAACSAPAQLGLQVPVAEATRCIDSSQSGMSIASVEYACTRFSDSVTTQGAGHWYVNCLGCPRLTAAGGAATTLGRYRFAGEGVAGGGCVLTTVLGVSGYRCNMAALVGCELNGVNYDCALSYRREPDVEQLENYLVMGFVVLCLIAGLSFGWKAVQRGTSQ